MPTYPQASPWALLPDGSVSFLSALGHGSISSPLSSCCHEAGQGLTHQRPCPQHLVSFSIRKMSTLSFPWSTLRGNQPWIFIGRTVDGAEASIFWPPNAKSQLTGKDPDDGKDWRQQEKGGSSGLRWLDTITDSMDMNLSKLWKTVEDRGGWRVTVCGVAKSQKRHSN